MDRMYGPHAVKQLLSQFAGCQRRYICDGADRRVGGGVDLHRGARSANELDDDLAVTCALLDGAEVVVLRRHRLAVA